nr:hypothetical protein CFP56_32948 [Quercus suber]
MSNKKANYVQLLQQLKDENMWCLRLQAYNTYKIPETAAQSIHTSTKIRKSYPRFAVNYEQRFYHRHHSNIASNFDPVFSLLYLQMPRMEKAN